MEKFCIGDIVQPKIEYLGHNDYFKIIDITPCDGIILEQLTCNHREFDSYELKNWRGYMLKKIDKNIKIPSLNNNINKKEKNGMLKILEIYEEKQTRIIEHEYDKQIEEIEQNDPVRVYLEQVSETLKEMLGEEATKAIEFCFPSNCTVNSKVFTPETIEKRNEIIKIIKDKKQELEDKIHEIQALLDLAPNYEEKIQILRDYGIMDKKTNKIL